MAKVGCPKDFVIDLGSGDGRMVITAAKKFGARGFGVDLDPVLLKRSNDNARAEGVADRARFVEQNLFEADLSQATVITSYLLPEMNEKLRPKILALKPGTRVVAHDYHMGEWLPDEERTLEVPEKKASIISDAEAKINEIQHRLRYPPSVDQRVGLLSGGNQQKVVFAKWLDAAPQVFLLDDPTRGVDVGAKAEMHSIIRSVADEGAIVVLCSTDVDEFTAICDRVVVFRRGRVAEIPPVRQAVSPSTGRRYPLTMICETWRVPRPSVYAATTPAPLPAGPGKRGPKPRVSDAEVVTAIRAVLATSPFHGEGYRKVRARLAHRGMAPAASAC